jgi:DNA-binding transcriptional MerR regulator
MVSKGPDAFRTISEVAEELDLPQHVLRFWETRFNQIKPMKRGGGRRYYRPDDVDMLRGIRHLLYGEGYTIRGVQRILKERGPRFVVGVGRGEIASAGPVDADVEEFEGVETALQRERGPVARMEPSFEDGDGDDHRPPEAVHRPPPAASAARRTEVDDDAPAPLTGAEVRQLHATLTELLELKRLLDQAR